MEFYDHLVLTKIGQKLGKLVKTDVCTSEALRGRYARICVEVHIGIPVRKKIAIGQHLQPLVYEGSNILCSACGVLGHKILTCPVRPGEASHPSRNEYTKPDSREMGNNTSENTTSKEAGWQIVTFSREQKLKSRPAQGVLQSSPGINVKLFYADT
ncbi:hypothetical protein H5410_020246, partial [Solanum commersonii]